ncbi:MoxR family ATPase [Vibrio kyushuensis]|uniref:AAA family ATPase n=1 Tax=Vibrio kyushuensis TaxID=2910249 RepID=UPI003D13F1D4
MDNRSSVLKLIEQTEQSIIGQSDVVRALVIALLTNGNLLLEGLPGTAKTRSIKMIANVLNAQLGRVQFTPDLLPSDLTGTEVYQEINGHQKLHFQKGPLFNNLVLADEVNRSPAKVQAALLEAMEERQVTIAGKTYPLPKLFLVMATQNPIEQEGTYPLPEAQLDRFVMKVSVHYPDDDAEEKIVEMVRREERTNDGDDELCHIEQRVIFSARDEINAITVAKPLLKYIVALVMATRHPDRYPSTDLATWISYGASSRATIALDKCARANAWLDGKSFADPDDVRNVIHCVLRHRIVLSYDAIADGVTTDDVINEMIKVVTVV